MKALFSGIAVAFSMYSSIPVPQVEWQKSTMKYALCFLPFIGLIVGGAQYLWLHIALTLGLSTLFYSAIAVLIPIVITGGIHLDGFIDTSDALCSYGDKAKKLEILKDPHVGAFGIIYIGVLLIFQLGLYSELFSNPQYAKMLLILFFFARSIGGGIIVTLKCAKNSGLAYIFSENADQKTVRIIMAIYLIIASVFMSYLFGMFGIAVILLNAIIFIPFKAMADKNFGGITGDLAGFFITSSETLTVLIAVIAGIIAR